MSSTDIHANIVAASRPRPNLGLATFYIKVPYYVWVEILTHKRLSRNASSARAQSPDRHVGEGYYLPPTFFENKKGMTVGKPVEDIIQREAQQVYRDVWEYCTKAVQYLEDLGISKEQSNRVVPAFKMVSALVTATEDGWSNFLELRDSSNADVAMQSFARKVRKELENERNWVNTLVHAPYYVTGDNIYSLIGKIARVTYNSYQEFSIDENEKLGKRLLKNRHMSPLEHIAVFSIDPYPSAICSKPEDCYFEEGIFDLMGWQSLRAEYEEHGKIDNTFLTLYS